MFKQYVKIVCKHFYSIVNCNCFFQDICDTKCQNDHLYCLKDVTCIEWRHEGQWLLFPYLFSLSSVDIFRPRAPNGKVYNVYTVWAHHWLQYNSVKQKLFFLLPGGTSPPASQGLYSEITSYCGRNKDKFLVTEGEVMKRSRGVVILVSWSPGWKKKNKTQLSLLRLLLDWIITCLLHNMVSTMSRQWL